MSLNKTPENLIKAITKTLPIHRENARINIETKKIPFDKTYNYEFNTETREVIIRSNQNDNMKITTRKSSGNKIIDICNQELTEFYKNVDKISIKLYEHTIIIEPLKELELQKKAKNSLNDTDITFTDIFAGSGLLTESMKLAGMIPKMAVEYVDLYLQNLENNNPHTITYNTDVSLMDFSLLPSTTVLVGGVPCDAHSIAGKRKKEDSKVGSLGYFFLRAVEQIRPAVCVVEEVVPFAKSAMRDMIVSVLEMRGYKISEKILNAADFGGIQARKRYVMVATMAEKPFVFSNNFTKNKTAVHDILEIPINERTWHDRHNSKTMKYSLEKEVEHIRKGDGFRLARTYLKDTKVAAITKGYYKWQLTSPILVHPNNPEKYSWFTPRELARLSGLPESFSFGKMKKTRIGQIIGQGVEVNCFKQLGLDIKKHIRENRTNYINAVADFEESKANVKNNTLPVNNHLEFYTQSLISFM